MNKDSKLLWYALLTSIKCNIQGQWRQKDWGGGGEGGGKGGGWEEGGEGRGGGLNDSCAPLLNMRKV